MIHQIFRPQSRGGAKTEPTTPQTAAAKLGAASLQTSAVTPLALCGPFRLRFKVGELKAVNLAVKYGVGVLLLVLGTRVLH